MKKGQLNYKLTKKILSVFSIDLPKKYIIKKIEDIFETLISENKNYILKVDSPDLIHKKDIGGVEFGINVKNIKEKNFDMFDSMEKYSKNFSLTLEEEVIGTETIIGLKSDNSLGNFLMFGAGGTYVSVFEDVNFMPCPLSHEDTKNIVEKSKINKILKGFRGSKPIHFEHLYELLVRMSYLQEVFPEIKEVDLNPVICNEKGVHLVDVKLII